MDTHHARLRIDSGSELTFVSESLIHQLNVDRQHSSIPIIFIGGKKTIQTLGMVKLTLESRNTSMSISIHAHILSTVSSILPSFQSPTQMWPHLEKHKLADPEFLQPRAIDIIFGADSYGQVIKPNIVKSKLSMPIAQLSIFGWLVLGLVHSSLSSCCMAYHTHTQPDNSELQNLLTKFWVQEEVPSDNLSPLTPEERECEDHFRSTHSRDSTGRYIVRHPLHSSVNLLGNSYPAAHHCLRRTLRKFQKDNSYKQLYQNFMGEYEQLGHMVRISKDSSSTQSGEYTVCGVNGEMTLAPDVLQTSRGLRVSSGDTQARTRPHVAYYLPNHGVLRPDSTTTKLKVVFHDSSPTSSGYSLNDLMHTGQNLLLDITDVLIWIRHHRHIFATDITKMYRQIKVHKEVWDLQRILWLNDELNEVHYQLTTVTYGTKAAPFLAVRTLLQLAEDEGYRFPLAMPSILKGRYVDDIFGGADTVDQLITIANQLC